MFGLSPDQQGHLFHASFLCIVLMSGLVPAWWARQYTLRGLVKRMRSYL